MKTMNINGKEYVAVDDLPPERRPDAEDGGVRIVVLQRGWVVVGRYRREGPRVVVSKAAVVRRWGTSKGLGELATKGPQVNTTLDDCPDVRCLESEIVLSMEATASDWQSRG